MCAFVHHDTIVVEYICQVCGRSDGSSNPFRDINFTSRFALRYHASCASFIAFKRFMVRFAPIRPAACPATSRR
jgi:hypothetical protein